MRKIIISIQNGLLADSLTGFLKLSGDFEPFRVAVDRKRGTLPACIAFAPDIVLMEVSRTVGSTLATRLEEAEQIRHSLPGCKVVLLCDENVSPDIAQDVITAKKAGRIDAFYYSSITVKYLVASLYAL